MMKIIALLLFTLSFSAMGATCTATSRNNYVTNQILTSSALNADFNQLVTLANAFDGGCVTAGTLESDALNTTQFAPMLKGIKEGCKVSYSSATQVSIGKCLAAVNGNFVTTTVATTVAFGCTSCSSEVASTVYYVYIATGSTGTTLTPLILTTAPNEDGYDNSGNKVLAKFYNNASSNIDQYSIYQWIVNGFDAPSAINMPNVSAPKTCRILVGGASATLAVPTELATAIQGVEVSDNCETGVAPTRSATGIYGAGGWAAGTWAASSPIDCKCTAFDATTGNDRDCSQRWVTGEDSWATDSDGSYTTTIISNDTSTTKADTYFSFTCTAAAP